MSTTDQQTQSEALRWVIDRLEPGILISVGGDDPFAIQCFVVEAIRAKNAQGVGVLGGPSPSLLQYGSLRDNVPAIYVQARNAKNIGVEAERCSDIVLLVEGDGVRVTKDRTQEIPNRPLKLTPAPTHNEV